MDSVDPLSLVLEFGRVESTSDPYGFQFSPQDYFLRHSHGGYDTARFPWTPELLRDLEAARQPGRDPATVQRLGDALRQFLKTTGWPSSEAQILNAVQKRQPIRLTVRSAAAEVYVLPWELMTLQPTGQHLGELPGLLLRYAWPDIEALPAEKAAPTAPGRILFAWSAAAGAVPALQHTEAIAHACAAGGQPFVIERDVLANVSCGRLLTTLAEAQAQGSPIAVLHLLVHGAPTGNAFGLALNGDVGEPDCVVVDAARLRQLLAPYANMVRLVVLAACDSGNSGALGNHLGSIAQELHRGRIAQVVASRYPLSVSGSIHFAEAFYAQLIAEPTSVEQAFLFARQYLIRDSSQLDWASLQLYSAPDDEEARPIQFRPYRGFLPFLPQHSRFFFGRERETEELINRFAALHDQHAPRFLLLGGPSGSGKSSLLFAAAVEPLRARLGEAAKRLELRLGQSPGQSPLQALQAAAAQCDSADKTLLVIDQFEELFTHCEDAAQRNQFSTLLWSLASSDRSSFSVIVTLRSDFFDQAAALCLDEKGRTLGPVMRDDKHCMMLAAPTPDKLRQIIVKPASRVGLAFEAGLVERILQELDIEPGALPLLEHALDLLWQMRSGDHLTQAAYEQIGGVAGALHAHADLLIDSFNADDQKEARRLLLWLGSEWSSEHQGTRRRVPLSTLRPAAADAQARFDRVLLRLVSERLLIISREPDEKGEMRYLVEVAHETLLRKWQRLLGWVREASQMLAARETLEHWAAEWRLHGTLLKGNQLGYALQLAEKFPEALSGVAEDLLAQSDAARQQEEALWQRGIDALRLLAARSTFGNDATRIALGLVESKYVHCDGIPGWLEAAIDITHNHVLTIAEGRFEEAVFDAAWGIDDDTVVVVVNGTGLKIFSKDLHEIRSLDVSSQEGSMNRVRVSPDGDRLLVLCDDGSAHVLATDGSGEKLCLTGHKASIESGCFSRDGKIIATASEDQTARLYDATSGKSLAVISGHEDGVTGVVISPDQRHIYTASLDGSVRVFTNEGRSKKPTTVFANEGVAIAALGMSADGTRLATGSSDGTVRVYDISNPETPTCLTGHTAKVLLVSFSPDGSRLLSSSEDQSALVWSLQGSRPPCLLRGHQNAIYAASWSRDGTQILTGSSDGRVRIWDATRATLFQPKLLRNSGTLPDDIVYETYALSLNETELRSPDGKAIAKVAAEDRIRIDFQPKGSAPFLISTEGEPILAMRFTPNSGKLIVISQKIRICDLAARTIVTLPGHRLPISNFTISGDSRFLITGSEDWTAKVWSLNEGSPPRVLTGHGNLVSLVLSNFTGSTILTVEWQGATRLWPKDGPPVILLPASRADHTKGVSKDLKRFVTQAAAESEVYIWDMSCDPAELKRRLRAATPLELTPDERQYLFLERKR